MATERERNKELVHKYLSAWDNGDPEAVTALLAEDFTITETDPEGEEIELDCDGFQKLVAGALTAIAEFDHEVHEMVAEDDQVMVRLTYTGVHNGELLGIEPTDNHIEVEEFLSFCIADGEIAELRWLGDNLALLRQLGVELPVG